MWTIRGSRLYASKDARNLIDELENFENILFWRCIAPMGKKYCDKIENAGLLEQEMEISIW